MRLSFQSTLFYLFILLGLSWLLSCDMVKEDVVAGKAFELQNDSLFTSVNSSGEINILLNDNVSGEASILIGQPVNGQATLTQIGKTLTYTPNKDYTGTDSLTYQVCGGDNCQSAKVFFKVLPTCQTQIIDFAFDKNQDLPGFSLLESDACPTASYKFLLLPQHGTATLEDGALFYKSAADYIGLDSLIVYAECQHPKQCKTFTFRFRIKDPANCQFKAFDERVTVWENSESINNYIAVRLNDDTCAAVTTSITLMPAHGEAGVDEYQQVYYKPAKNYTGPDQITYTICQENGQCSSANVYFTVEEDRAFESCKTKLSAKSDMATVVRVSSTTVQQVEIDVLANDILCSEDPDDIIIKILNQPQKGKVVGFADSNNKQKLLYETTFTESGSDKFRYQLCYRSRNFVDEICKEAEVEITIK